MVGTADLGSWNGHWIQPDPSMCQHPGVAKVDGNVRATVLGIAFFTTNIVIGSTLLNGTYNGF